MSEGTKLGEFKDHQAFNTAVAREEDFQNQDSSATKMGELSEFEKSLYGDDSPAKSTKSVTPSSNTESANTESSSAAEAAFASEQSDYFENELDRLIVDYQEGDIIKGIVRRVEKSGVMVDISFKSDGFIVNAEFSNDPDEVPSDFLKPGDEISVFIVNLESKEGYTVLSKKRADYELAWGKVNHLAKTRDTIQVKVNSKVQGGVVADYFGIKGFIPASQLLTDSESDLQIFVNQTLEVCVLQADRRRRKVIFSHKQAQSKSQRNDYEQLINDLEVGEVRPGKVTSIKDFGVFVDLGGVEGLVHISELSWSRVNHPSEIVKLGQAVNVFILGVDRESRKVSLGMKQLEPDPWVAVAEKYKVGQVIEGTITRLAAFGAFIRIDDHLEGLIHISELSMEHVNAVSDVVSPGQVVNAKIIKLIPSEQKIGLSLKAIQRDAAAAASAAEESSSVEA